ncbi:MAG: hypothetical protein JKY31_13105 [Rhodobacteraceae bacterium]|nr:hypothetical protein [Paracoccaceae bacterium]
MNIANWKGEAGIRAIPKTGAGGGQYKPVPKLPKVKPRRGGVCAVPGCDHFLTERNTSRVCRDHNHIKIHCECKICKP